MREQEKAMKKHKKKHKSPFWLSIIIVQSYVVFVLVKTAVSILVYKSNMFETILFFVFTTSIKRIEMFKF